MLDARRVSRLIVRAMKKLIFPALAVAAVVMTGCVNTVTDSSSIATTWSKDTVAGRYNRTVDQVYQASVAVIQLSRSQSLEMVS